MTFNGRNIIILNEQTTLINTIYKVILKIIGNIIKKVLPKLISEREVHSDTSLSFKWEIHKEECTQAELHALTYGRSTKKSVLKQNYMH